MLERKQGASFQKNGERCLQCCSKLFSRGFSSIQFSSVQFSRSVVSDSLRPHESQPSSHLILCCPLLLLPLIPPSIRVFSSESTLHTRWPTYWSFGLSISPSKEHPGLVSFRMDWLDLLAVQGTLKSLLQHHSSKASILRLLIYLYSATDW